MADRKILRGVRHDGRLFRAGSRADADALDKALTSEQVKELKDRDPPVIEGDFSGGTRPSANRQEEGGPASHQQADTSPPRGQGVKRTYGEDAKKEGVKVERASDPEKTVSQTSAPWEKKQGGEPASEELPEDFPARQHLIDQGYTTKQQVKDASDDELEKLEGIGEATVKKIRAAVK